MMLLNIQNLKKIVSNTKFVRLNGAHNNLKWHYKICNLINFHENSKINN